MKDENIISFGRLVTNTLEYMKLYDIDSDIIELTEKILNMIKDKVREHPAYEAINDITGTYPHEDENFTLLYTYILFKQNPSYAEYVGVTELVNNLLEKIKQILNERYKLDYIILKSLEQRGKL